MNSPAKPDAETADASETEHQLQVGLALALCDAVRAGADSARAQQILEQLAGYSEAHFMSEQLLMRLAGYPEYDEHVVDHDHMMEVLQGIATSIAEGGGALTAGEAEDMLYFLSRHIATRDRRFAEYHAEWRRQADERKSGDAPAADR